MNMVLCWTKKNIFFSIWTGGIPVQLSLCCHLRKDFLFNGGRFELKWTEWEGEGRNEWERCEPECDSTWMDWRHRCPRWSCCQHTAWVFRRIFQSCPIFIIVVQMKITIPKQRKWEQLRTSLSATTTPYLDGSSTFVTKMVPIQA